MGGAPARAVGGAQPRLLGRAQGLVRRRRALQDAHARQPDCAAHRPLLHRPLDGVRPVDAPAILRSLVDTANDARLDAHHVRGDLGGARRGSARRERAERADGQPLAVALLLLRLHARLRLPELRRPRRHLRAAPFRRAHVRRRPGVPPAWSRTTQDVAAVATIFLTAAFLQVISYNRQPARRSPHFSR